jgi:signal transduction histidine kinase
MVWGDAGKLTQVFSNVIDNAMKYTQKGGITMSVVKDTGKNIAHVEIRDTGIGMDDATRSKIFEKFIRGDNAQAVNNGGSGLGLFIVKTFVEAHKGKIWPASDGVGKGTVFSIELPLLIQN